MKNIDLSSILLGYIGFLKHIVRMLLFLCLISAAAITITAPFWYWATHHRSSFNLFVLLVLVLLASLWLFQKMKRAARNSSGETSSLIPVFLKPLRKIVSFVVSIILLYSTLYLFSAGNILFGSLWLLGVLFVMGLIFFHSRT